MDRIKPYLEAAEKHIRSKQFKEALDQAEMALLFMGTNFQANLYAATFASLPGRCCIELKDYNKAEMYVKQALQSKPDDMDCLKSLCILYKQMGKNEEYYQTLRKLTEAFKAKKMYAQYFDQVLKFYERYLAENNFPKLQEIYEELAKAEGIEEAKKKELHMKFFKDAFAYMDYNKPQTEEMLINALKSCQSPGDLEEIIGKSIGLYVHKYVKNGRYKEFYYHLLKLEREYPKSIVLLKPRIEYSYFILDEKDKLIELYQEVVCFMLLNHVFPNVSENLLNEAKSLENWQNFLKYENLSVVNKPLFNEINTFAVIFQKFFEISNLTNLVADLQVIKILEKLPKTRIEYCFELAEKLNFILAYPIKISFFLMADDKAMSTAQHKEFLAVIQKNRASYNLNVLEEVHASLGLQIGLNPEELVSASNNIKALLRQDPDNIENMKLFYNYQSKIIKQLHRVDEDINLFNVSSVILDKEPNNPFYLSEKAWLTFSNQKLADNFTIIEQLLTQALENSGSQDHHFQAQIRLRLGTIYLLKDPNNKENIQKARDFYLGAWQLDPNEAKAFKSQALLYAFIEKNYGKALQCLNASMDTQKADEEFFKLHFFLLIKSNFKEQAINLLKAVYRLFRNSFWVNYTLGVLLMVLQFSSMLLTFAKENQDHQRSLPLIMRACEIYEYSQKEKPYRGYKRFEGFGTKYLVQTNGFAYLEDIPFLSNSFYENNEARTLSDNFFLAYDPMTEFHLYYLYCQQNKNLGKIGSAFKTLERLEGCLEKTEKVNLEKIPQAECPLNDDRRRYEDLSKARKLIQEEFVIRGRAAQKPEELEVYDMRRHGIEVLIYYITKATLSSYLGESNECFKSIAETLKYLSIAHKWKIPGLNYKKAMILERELISVMCEAMVKYAEHTLAKEIIDLALHRLDIAFKVLDCCKEVIQESISVSNIYLNRCLCDLYLFKGLHGHCEESLLKAEDYLRRILKVCLVGYDEIEAGSFEKRGEISEKMLEEGRCAKNQELVYESLYNMALINLNLARRKPETPVHLNKARNLAKFGILNFESNSAFWVLYAFTEESDKKRNAALLAGIAVNPENLEAINALSYSFLKEKKASFAIKLLLKSLEIDTVENYKAFNGLGLVNIIIGLELLKRKNGIIEGKKNYVKGLFENAKHFLDKAYFYTLNSQEITQTPLAEKFQAIFFYLCGDFEKAVDHFENYFRYQRGKKDNNQDSVFWQYYILSLVKCGRKALFLPTVKNDSFITPDILALIDKATPSNHQYQDKIYSRFLHNLANNGKNDELANVLIDDLEKLLEEWKMQSAEWLTKGASGQMNLYKAFAKFLEILRLIQMIASLFLIDKQYQDCYMFLTDHLEVIKDMENLKKLEKYQLDYHNLCNEYQKILYLYLDCLVLILKNNQAKDPASVHHDLELVIVAISDNSVPDSKGPFNLIFNQDTKGVSEPKSLATVELLSGVANLLIGDLKKAKLHLIKALKCDCESLLVRRVLSLYYVLHERKYSIVHDYNLATFDEYKIRRDNDLDSTNNANKNRPLYLDLVGEETSSFALLEYLTAYNKCTNPEKRRKLITRAAMYLRDINVWFLYCVEMLQDAKERIPRKLYNLLSVLYLRVINEIVNLKSAERRESYKKTLKKAIKVACEIGLLYERSGFSEKEEKAEEVKELLNKINKIGSEVIGSDKISNYKKKLDIFHDYAQIAKVSSNELSGLFKTDISSIVFIRDICVKLYNNNWRGDLEGLLSSFRKHLYTVIEEKDQKNSLPRKDRMRLEGALLQTELMLYTLYLRETVLTEGKPEAHVNALEKLGEAFEWCKSHINKNKQVYTLIINHYNQIEENDSVEAYLTAINYLDCPENVTQTANLYCLLAFYNKLKSEFVSVEEKEELFENIGIIAEDILANPQESSYVLGVTYYVKGLCELMKAGNSQTIDPKKVKSVFAKAALFVPAHAKSILKNLLS